MQRRDELCWINVPPMLMAKMDAFPFHLTDGDSDGRGTRRSEKGAAGADHPSRCMAVLPWRDGSAVRSVRQRVRLPFAAPDVRHRIGVAQFVQLLDAGDRHA